MKAVIAESFERIHRSNLVNMGVLPLEFKAGENAASLGLTGARVVRPGGRGRRPDAARRPHASWRTAPDGKTREFVATVRIDTPEELVSFRHGGILPYVVRQLVAREVGRPPHPAP